MAAWSILLVDVVAAIVPSLSCSGELMTLHDTHECWIWLHKQGDISLSLMARLSVNAVQWHAGFQPGSRLAGQRQEPGGT